MDGERILGRIVIVKRLRRLHERPVPDGYHAGIGKQR